MLSTRYNVGSLLAAGAYGDTPDVNRACQQVATRVNDNLRWGGFTDKMCLSIAAQILAAAALFSAANIVSMLICVLEAQVRSVFKESAYCRMSSL